MSRTVALARRELLSYFLSPTGYVITALFLLLTGFIFIFFAFRQGATASMRPVFGMGVYLLLFIGPAISMRTISEEARMGTLEPLMTSPVSAAEIVIGKFLGSYIFLLAMLAPTLVFVGLLEFYGRPDYGELACGYLGLMLAGAAFLAVGILTSALSPSQVVAFLASLFFWLILVALAKSFPIVVGRWFSNIVPDEWLPAIAAFDPDVRLRDFVIGLIDTGNIVYFVSITVLFILVAIRVVEARRHT